MIFKNKFTALYIGIFLSAFWAVPALAQMTVSPLVIERQANRNQAQGLITLRNEGNEPFRVRVYTEPFTYDREKGFQALDSSPSDLSPYLQFSPRELTIPAGTTRRVRFIARLAPNLADGEYRSVLFAEKLSAVTPDTPNSSQVAIIARIGITIFVRKGEVVPQLSVLGARYLRQSNEMQFLVQNSGQASARPNGTWTLKQGSTPIRSGDLNPTTILPQAERYFVISPQEAEQPKLAPGNYQLTGELSWGSDETQNMLPFTVDLTVPAGAVSANE